MIRAAYANGVWFQVVPAESLVDHYADNPLEVTAECAGCLFDKSPAKACGAANQAALAAGLPSCESRPDKGKPGYVYIRDPSGGRQMDLLDDSG